MRFQVPQFIEVEDKIFGPLTFKQFVYLAGGGGICVTAYYSLPIFWSIFVIGPVAALSAALAFYKVNGRPFIQFLESLFYFYVRDRFYIWKKSKPVQKQAVRTQAEERSSSYVPKLSGSRLKDLAWSLDISTDPDSADAARGGEK